MATLTDNSFDRLGIMLFAAVVIHAVVILGITFDFTDRASQPPAQRTLDIIVVHQPKKSEPVDDARFFAQAAQQGGGETEIKERPTSRPSQPIPPTPSNIQPTSTPTETSIPETPIKADKVVTVKKSAVKVVNREHDSKTPNKKSAPTLQEILASTNQQISELTAEIDRRNQMFSQKSRRKHISAATKEYLYAGYLDAWRRKVVRVGNLNYPEEAKRKKLYGELVLHVAVRADGTLERVRILRSSGIKVLDDAAIRIVKLAAPYAPFPAEIRKHVDVLDITRTWQFGDDNQLFTR